MYSCIPKYPPLALRCGVIRATLPPSSAAFFCRSSISLSETVPSGRQPWTRFSSSTSSTAGLPDAHAASVKRHTERIHGRLIGHSLWFVHLGPRRVHRHGDEDTPNRETGKTERRTRAGLRNRVA